MAAKKKTTPHLSEGGSRRLLRALIAEVGRIFLWAVVLPIITYVSTNLAAATSLLRIDPLTQLVIALVVGLAVTVVGLVRVSARHIREKRKLGMQLQQMRLQLERLYDWIPVESIDIELTKSHPREVMRHAVYGVGWVRVIWEAAPGDLFDADISSSDFLSRLDPSRGSRLANQGTLSIDEKANIPRWDKKYLALMGGHYYFAVQLPKGRSGAKLKGTLFTLNLVQKTDPKSRQEETRAQGSKG